MAQYRVTNLHGVAGSAAIQYVYTVERDEYSTDKKTRKKAEPKFKVETASAIPRCVYLTICVILSAVLCYNYITLRMDIAAASKNIDRMQTKLLNMEKANEEEYDRIMSRVDIEEIRRTATEELHMIYPTQEQVQVISEIDEDDYVRQLKDFK